MVAVVNTEAMEAMLRPFLKLTQIAPLPATTRLMTHHAVEARSRLEQKCCSATWKNLCLQRWETDGGRSTKLNAVHSHYEVMCLIIVSLKNGQLTKGQM
jgi:hypothetical protein